MLTPVPMLPDCGTQNSSWEIGAPPRCSASAGPRRFEATTLALALKNAIAGSSTAAGKAPIAASSPNVTSASGELFSACMLE